MMTAINLLILFSLAGLLLLLKLRGMVMSARVIISLVLGVSFGFFARLTAPDAVLESILSLVGNGYLGLLKMLVIPLILTSIIHAIINLGDDHDGALKKISFLTCGILLGTTALSSLIGLFAGTFFGVGEGMIMPADVALPANTGSSFVDTLLHMIPSNPVAAMASENTIAVVIFAVLTGIAARMLDAADHDKMLTFREMIAALFAIVKKLAHLILSFTPYAILALMSMLILKQGATLLSGVLNVIAAMYAAMFLVLLMHSTLLLLFGYSPVQYFKNAMAPLFVAFTTRSSFGTLPVTEETLRDKFKVNQMVASFTPSFGATLGMNACAGVYPAVLVVMVLNIMHLPLTTSLIVSVMLVNTLASLGISGIPGTAYIAATISLTSLNLPYAVIALVQGVDPIIDMGRTAVNVNGAMTTALITQRVIGTADEGVAAGSAVTVNT
jgi:L-cystine uptake protein TcyP (sodium:dicarboxylate symporter family)